MRPILYGCSEHFREFLSTPTATFAESFPCSPESRATKSEDVGLIVRAIGFQDV